MICSSLTSSAITHELCMYKLLVHCIHSKVHKGTYYCLLTTECGIGLQCKFTLVVFTEHPYCITLGLEALRLLFGDKFVQQVESVGLLFPDVVNPSSTPDTPSRHGNV